MGLYVGRIQNVYDCCLSIHEIWIEYRNNDSVSK